jgi:hypothetical protein
MPIDGRLYTEACWWQRIAEQGQAGENALGIGPGKQRIPAPSGTAAYRVPDRETPRTVLDVKNVSRLALDDQMRDMMAHASATDKVTAMDLLQASGAIRVFKWLPPLDL